MPDTSIQDEVLSVYWQASAVSEYSIGAWHPSIDDPPRQQDVDSVQLKGQQLHRLQLHRELTDLYEKRANGRSYLG